MLAITKHSQKRFRERYGIKKIGEMMRISKCAFRNGVTPENKYLKLIKQGYQTFIYKELMDNIYVFGNNDPDIVLITLYPKK